MNDLPIEQWSPLSWKRDPEHPCSCFDELSKQYDPDTMQGGECETDGHYLCAECSEAKRCDCGLPWTDGSMTKCEVCMNITCDQCGFYDGYQFIHKSCDHHLLCLEEEICNCANGPFPLEGYEQSDQ